MTIEEKLEKAEKERDDAIAAKEDMGKNLVNQRKELEAARDAAIAEATEAKGLVEANETKARQELTDYQEKRIEAISKGDKTIAEKIRAEYQNLSLPEDSRESIDTRALKAYQLATAVEPNGFASKPEVQLTGVDKTDSTELTPEAAAVGAKMFPQSQAFNPSTSS